MKKTLIFILLLLPIGTQAGLVYKWTDDRNRVQFSGKPPKQQQNVEILTTLDYPELETRKPEKPDVQDEDQGEGSTSTDQEAAEPGIPSQKQVEYCKKLAANTKVLKGDPRVRIKRENGEYEILDDEGKQTEIDRLKKLVDEFC